MMPETYSLALALFDFIPNFAFLGAAYFLVRIVSLARGTRCARMMLAGTLLVFLGGALKATWKLLYAIGAGDITLFGEAQFVLLAPGFLAMLVAVWLIARRGKTQTTPAFAMAVWKIPFLAIMTICSLGAQGLLAWVAFRRNLRIAVALFAIALLGTLAMAGMASGEQTVARQWLEEGINTVGQVALMLGSYRLYRDVRARPQAC